jgi:hypothetical protein
LRTTFFFHISLFMWVEAILTWVISKGASFVSQKRRTSQGPILAPLNFGSSIGCLVLSYPAFKEPFLALRDRHQGGVHQIVVH